MRYHGSDACLRMCAVRAGMCRATLLRVQEKVIHPDRGRISIADFDAVQNRKDVRGDVVILLHYT